VILFNYLAIRIKNAESGRGVDLNLKIQVRLGTILLRQGLTHLRDLICRDV
jgi:hypothetical protein